jgi:hypothetical protein
MSQIIEYPIWLYFSDEHCKSIVTVVLAHFVFTIIIYLYSVVSDIVSLLKIKFDTLNWLFSVIKYF